MTTERRLKNNEIIGRYMNHMFSMGCISDYKILPEDINKKYLKYHSDWNQLMRATKKISIEIDIECSKRKLRHLELEEAQKDIVDALLKMQIESVWEAVLKGIQVINRLVERDDENK